MTRTTDGPPRTPRAARARTRWTRATRLWATLVVLLVALGAADQRRTPDEQLGARWALAGIDWYQRTLSARLPSFGVSCRFVPTCSRYAHAVIGEHGLWTGTRLTLGRLVRCGPWTPHGTVDPPPHRTDTRD